MSAELLGRSASELTQDLATRRIRATELMAACLARIEEVNPALNAICTVDGEAALADSPRHLAPVHTFTARGPDWIGRPGAER